MLVGTSVRLQQYLNTFYKNNWPYGILSFGIFVINRNQRTLRYVGCCWTNPCMHDIKNSRVCRLRRNIWKYNLCVPTICWQHTRTFKFDWYRLDIQTHDPHSRPKACAICLSLMKSHECITIEELIIVSSLGAMTTRTVASMPLDIPCLIK